MGSFFGVVNLSLCLVAPKEDLTTADMVFNVGALASYRLHRLRENDHGEMTVTRMCWDIQREIYLLDAQSVGKKENRINDPVAIAYSFRKGVTNYFTLPEMRDPQSPIHALFLKNKDRFSEQHWDYLMNPDYQQQYNSNPGTASTISREQIGNPNYAAIRADAIHSVRSQLRPD